MAALCAAAFCLAATSGYCGTNVTVVIPWQDGAPFSTNLYFYTTEIGETCHLKVVPTNCFKFKAAPTWVENDLTVVQDNFTVCEVNYGLTIVSTNKQGSVTISGEIEPGNCGTGCGGGGGAPVDQDFTIDVLQRLVWGFYTDPSNGTNLVCCGGTTNSIAVKLLLGDATAPLEGKADFSLSPTSLGTLFTNQVELTPMGVATNLFIATADSAGATSGTVTVTGIELKDERTNSVPNASTNLTVRIFLPDLDIDSDNNSDFGLNGDEAEDSVEEESPGKFVHVYDVDNNTNGIPDFAEMEVADSQFYEMTAELNGCLFEWGA